MLERKIQHPTIFQATKSLKVNLQIDLNLEAKLVNIHRAKINPSPRDAVHLLFYG